MSGSRVTNVSIGSNIPLFVGVALPAYFDRILTWNDREGHVVSPCPPSVGIIIYQSRLKLHRPLWCWLGWGMRSDERDRGDLGGRPASLKTNSNPQAGATRGTHLSKRHEK